ncbi:MAG: hypothetical protein MUF49_03585 [Oculatellaceae cyanobacterium Prado106]|jgi:hypothetical protein|nr:hypothetical protein [Oculatellaceae cyanobacterium Prado106]
MPGEKNRSIHPSVHSKIDNSVNLANDDSLANHHKLGREPCPGCRSTTENRQEIRLETDTSPDRPSPPTTPPQNSATLKITGDEPNPSPPTSPSLTSALNRQNHLDRPDDGSKCLHQCWQSGHQRSLGHRCLVACWQQGE